MARKKKQHAIPFDYDAVYDLLSQRGRIRIERRGNVTLVDVEPFREPPTISVPYANNSSLRADSADVVRRIMAYHWRM